MSSWIVLKDSNALVAFDLLQPGIHVRATPTMFTVWCDSRGAQAFKHDFDPKTLRVVPCEDCHPVLQDMIDARDQNETALMLSLTGTKNALDKLLARVQAHVAKVIPRIAAKEVAEKTEGWLDSLGKAAANDTKPADKQP